ncbi:hypothetical protein [Aurantiacibacter spongiae]|nr:hypothetical protein [Aurantiacibacter spongiae]
MHASTRPASSSKKAWTAPRLIHCDTIGNVEANIGVISEGIFPFSTTS